MDEGGFYDMIYQKFKSRNWFIILIPVSIDSVHLPYQIEHTFYPPKTPKNAGFEITYDHEHYTTLIFCHKKYMNHKQLSAILAQNLKPVMDIPKNKDIVALKGFNEPETFYWIKKIDQECDKIQEKANTLHHPESVMIPILTKNPEVARECHIYYGMRSLYENIMDFIYKKMSGE